MRVREPGASPCVHAEAHQCSTSNRVAQSERMARLALEPLVAAGILSQIILGLSAYLWSPNLGERRQGLFITAI